MPVRRPPYWRHVRLLLAMAFTARGGVTFSARTMKFSSYVQSSFVVFSVLVYPGPLEGGASGYDLSVLPFCRIIRSYHAGFIWRSKRNISPSLISSSSTGETLGSLGGRFPFVLLMLTLSLEPQAQPSGRAWVSLALLLLRFHVR